MLTFLFGAFGLSTLWLIPLLWRGLRALVAKGRKRPVGGEGTIRHAQRHGGSPFLPAAGALAGIELGAEESDHDLGLHTYSQR